MTAEKIIAALIQNFDFEQASQVYQQFGTNETFKKDLAKGANHFSIFFLKKELPKILSGLKAEATIPEEKEIDSFSFAPENVQSLDKEWRTLFKDASARQQRLVYDKSPDAYRYCVQIIENFERIREIWEHLDYWKANKTLPVRNEKTELSDLPSLLTRQKTVERYIRKYKDKPSQKAKYEMELQEIKKNIDAFRS